MPGIVSRAINEQERIVRRTFCNVLSGGEEFGTGIQKIFQITAFQERTGYAPCLTAVRGYKRLYRPVRCAAAAQPRKEYNQISSRPYSVREWNILGRADAADHGNRACCSHGPHRWSVARHLHRRKLYFFQIESREFSSGAESSDLGDFIEALPDP